jgi:hypothetical protein
MKHHVHVKIEFTAEVETDEGATRERVELLAEEAWERDFGYHDDVEHLRVSAKYVPGENDPESTTPFSMDSFIPMMNGKL